VSHDIFKKKYHSTKFCLGAHRAVTCSSRRHFMRLCVYTSASNVVL